jgi:hypothetical protein
LKKKLVIVTPAGKKEGEGKGGLITEVIDLFHKPYNE